MVGVVCGKSRARDSQGAAEREVQTVRPDRKRSQIWRRQQKGRKQRGECVFAHTPAEGCAVGVKHESGKAGRLR